MKDYNSKIRIAYFGSNHIENIYDNFFSKFENIEIKYQYIDPSEMWKYIFYLYMHIFGNIDKNHKMWFLIFFSGGLVYVICSKVIYRKVKKHFFNNCEEDIELDEL